MKIIVIGGSGLIGSKLVNKLCAHGHEAMPLSLLEESVVSAARREPI
jgi:nucleoside-diphosphate-sugar epimerase